MYTTNPRCANTVPCAGHRAGSIRTVMVTAYPPNLSPCATSSYKVKAGVPFIHGTLRRWPVRLIHIVDQHAAWHRGSSEVTLLHAAECCAIPSRRIGNVMMLVPHPLLGADVVAHPYYCLLIEYGRRWVGLHWLWQRVLERQFGYEPYSSP